MPELYYLMNKDDIVLTLREEADLDDTSYVVETRHGSYLPYGFKDINSWIETRRVAKHRKQIYSMMKDWGIQRRKGFIDFTHCVSLTDTFWIRAENSDLEWKDVSLFINPFNDVIAHLAFDGAGLYGKNLDSTTPEFATSGSFEKCWRRTDDGISLYKRGSRGAVYAGMEPYSEKLTSDLLEAMNINHATYTLTRYHHKLASVCPIFTSEEYGFVSFAAFTDKNTVNTRELLDTVGKVCDEDRFREMVIADAISFNVDRHQGNYGFLVDNQTGEVKDFAPLFDHNMSQLPYLMETDDVEEYLRGQGPRIGTDFVAIARALMTPKYQAMLINLKDYEYTDPGYDYPGWKMGVLNRVKNEQIERILRG